MSDPYLQIIDQLTAAKRVLVTTHVRPDGDALGSVAAMAMALKVKSIAAEVLLLSHLPTKYSFIFKENQIAYHDAENGWPVELDLNQFDCFLVIDTGTWSQLPGLKERVSNWNVPKLVVDHHLTQEGWATTKLVDTSAAAAGEIVAELLSRWDITIGREIATALYLAITSDTGWFQFSNTRPYTLRLAAQLMEVGVNTDQLYQLIYQNERAERLKLQASALQSLELMEGNRLAVMTIHKSDFEKTGAAVPDTENLINLPLQVATVEMSVLIVEPGDFGPVRISCRSKGNVNVAKFAEQFGGGGHARASGLKIEGTLIDVRNKVVEAAKEAVGQMSHGS